MTTLNAKANTAYNELIAKTERENPGDVWAGFDGDQDAFETGYETGYEAAQPVVDRKALENTINEVAVATGLAKYFKSGGAEDPSDVEEFVAAVLALLNGTAK